MCSVDLQRTRRACLMLLLSVCLSTPEVRQVYVTNRSLTPYRYSYLCSYLYPSLPLPKPLPQNMALTHIPHPYLYP